MHRKQTRSLGSLPMASFQRKNRILAGLLFILSFLLYFSTMAPTVSFWDCGEFIATAYTLGVPHPPGSPLFLLLGRIFSMVPTNPDIGFRVNLMSPISTALAVMLVYLILVKLIGELRQGLRSRTDQWIAMGGALVGALVFAVTDSNWFNAVESEVYAMSIFFTAMVIWLILLWSEKADQPDQERYLLLIAYLIGLAIGVHLLNLLALPYIALVMYFRKREFEWKSFLAVVAITGIAFFTINTGIIKGLPRLALDFGLFGLALVVLIIVGVGVWAIRRKRVVLSLIFSSIILILIGYSTYTVIFIRSNQDPSIDENNPETIPAAISYLEREQYGAIGQLPRKYPGLPSKPEVVGRPAHGREYSAQQNREYAFYNFGKQWDFFWDYQVKKMYWRYFLWQFAGRGPSTDPGVTPFGANAREDGVDWLQFGLPLALLLGLFGLGYNIYKNPKQAFTIFTLFFFTGLAVIIYLNQDNPQPRERDYSYVGSFLAFSLWIGIGAAGILDQITTYIREKKLAERVSLVTVAGMLIFIPGLMLRANYDEHDRSGNYVAWDMSYNFLQSCEPNAIIFTNGDNDTFPLWYLQEVEGIRKDVTVANLSLLNTPWYIKQLRDSRPPGERFIRLSDEQIDDLASGLQPWKKQKVRIPVPDDPENPDGYLEWTLEPTYANAALKVQDMMIMRIINDARWKYPIYFAVTVSPTNKIGLDDYLTMEGLVFHLYSHKVDPVDPEVMEANLMNRIGDLQWSREFTPEWMLAKDHPAAERVPTREPQRGYLFRNLGNPEVYYNRQIIRLLQNYRSAYMQLAIQYYFQWQDAKQSTPQDTTVIRDKQNKVLAVLDEMERNLPVETIPMEAKELYLQVGQLYGELGAKDKERAILDDLADDPGLSLRNKLHLSQSYIQDLNEPETGRDILKDLYDTYLSLEEAVQRQGIRGTGLDRKTWNTWQRNLPEIVSYLVMVYRDLDQKEDAIAVLNDWIQRNPQDQSAKSMLEELQKAD
ncbi:MAG: DUF2723 domain-containing protein [Candidatus Neomarinimicrobiota bacterium]|nr:MAG: DUF2723 domain-containing protein [Candidatus Neomarinimicrobiota bacterium]